MAFLMSRSASKHVFFLLLVSTVQLGTAMKVGVLTYSLASYTLHNVVRDYYLFMFPRYISLVSSSKML